MLVVVMVIDPGSQSIPQAPDEGQRDLFEPAALDTSESNVQHQDPTGKVGSLRQPAWRSEHDLGGRVGRWLWGSHGLSFSARSVQTPGQGLVGHETRSLAWLWERVQWSDTPTGPAQPEKWAQGLPPLGDRRGRKAVVACPTVTSVSREIIASMLPHVLERTSLDELGSRYEGKVRDCYSMGDGRRLLVTTDRISAFDRVLGTLPLKGQLLNHCAHFWFRETAAVAPNHYLSLPDPNLMMVRECRPLPVEMVVRAYLTGTTSTSIWVHYERGERTFCGHTLPDGMRKHQALPRPILTPSTKAAKGAHDVSLSREGILQEANVSPEDFDHAAEMALSLFRRGQALCAERGLILVDTKYEFGKTPEGDLVVIDEIHTPDSSRFWYADTYQERFDAGLDPDSFDKEYVRRWLASRGFKGEGPAPQLPDEVRVEATSRYIQAVESITGEPFRPHLSVEPVARIRRNLGLG